MGIASEIRFNIGAFSLKFLLFVKKTFWFYCLSQNCDKQ